LNQENKVLLYIGRENLYLTENETRGTNISIKEAFSFIYALKYQRYGKDVALVVLSFKISSLPFNPYLERMPSLLLVLRAIAAGAIADYDSTGDSSLIASTIALFIG